MAHVGQKLTLGFVRGIGLGGQGIGQGGGFGQLAVGLAQLVPGLGNLGALVIDLAEDTYLAEQDLRLDRFEDVVHPAVFVALEDVLLFLIDGGKKNNGNAFGLLVDPQKLGRFVAVHLGHLHIKKNERVVVFERETERLVARRR